MAFLKYVSPLGGNVTTIVTIQPRRKVSEPSVGKRKFNPLSKERLTNSCFSGFRGKKDSPKTILKEPLIVQRLKLTQIQAQQEANRIWNSLKDN